MSRLLTFITTDGARKLYCPVMSDQAAPAQQGPDLHQLALDTYKNAQELATGLAHAGVDPTVTQAVSKASDVFHKVAQALGKGQAQTADNAPPAPAPPQSGGPRPSMDQGVAAVHQETQRAAQQGGGY